MMNSVFMFAEDFVSHPLKTMCVGFFFFNSVTETERDFLSTIHL